RRRGSPSRPRSRACRQNRAGEAGGRPASACPRLFQRRCRRRASDTRISTFIAPRAILQLHRVLYRTMFWPSTRLCRLPGGLRRQMELTVATVLVAFSGVFLICFMKGAFGGGFSIIGIPLMSTVMDPVTAGGLLAPLFIAMDLFALRYWKPSTWSRPDLV